MVFGSSAVAIYLIVGVLWSACSLHAYGWAHTPAAKYLDMWLKKCYNKLHTNMRHTIYRNFDDVHNVNI